MACSSRSGWWVEHEYWVRSSERYTWSMSVAEIWIRSALDSLWEIELKLRRSTLKSPNSSRVLEREGCSSSKVDSSCDRTHGSLDGGLQNYRK